MTFNNENRMAGVVTCVCNPSYINIETEGSQVQEWGLKAWKFLNNDRKDKNQSVASHNLEKHYTCFSNFKPTYGTI